MDFVINLFKIFRLKVENLISHGNDMARGQK